MGFGLLVHPAVAERPDIAAGIKGNAPMAVVDLINFLRELVFLLAIIFSFLADLRKYLKRFRENIMTIDHLLNKIQREVIVVIRSLKSDTGVLFANLVHLPG